MLAAAVCALAWPARATPSGAFAVAVTGSAIVYVLSFSLLGVAAEFRYGYWCVLATLAGSVTAIAARSEASALRPHHRLLLKEPLEYGAGGFDHLVDQRLRRIRPRPRTHRQ